MMHTGLAISLLLALASSVSGKKTVLRGNQNENQIADRKLQDATITELAVSTESLSTLVSLLPPGLVADLGDKEATYTVFAPTNDAFNKLPQATLDALAADPDLLLDVLEYHIIEGAAVLSSDLEVGLAPETVEGSTVEVTSLTPVTINDAVVTLPDVLASNGVVHLIDTVLIPPDDMGGDGPTTSPPESTIAELAIATDSLSTLVSLLPQSVVEALSDENATYTVFAPTNDAFAKLPQATLDAVTSDPDLLLTILQYHLIDGAAVLSSDLEVGLAPETVLGSTVEVTSLTPVTINNAIVTTADVLASNGVVHLIDTVLIPTDDTGATTPPVATTTTTAAPDAPGTTTVAPPSTGSTIVDLAVNTPELSTLALLLGSAGFTEVISGPGPFTVFAPSNAAFNKLSGARWIAQNPALLNPILLYHVVGDATILSTDLTLGAAPATLEGHPVTVTSLDPVMINRAMVTTADVVASNGVVHIIDDVLIPPFMA